MSVEQCGKSICLIEFTDDTGRLCTGSGFCVSVAGFPVIATNHHVVRSLECAHQIKCTFSKFLSQASSIETIVKMSPDNVPCYWDADKHHELIYSADGQCINKFDFVFIRCTLLDKLVTANRITPLHFEAHHINFENKDRIVIWGHPHGQPLSCSFGSINHVSPTHIMYDVGTAGGSSGSPIFSAKSGNVVGIHHSASHTENFGTLSFSIVQLYMQHGIRDVFQAAHEAQEMRDTRAIAYAARHLQCHTCLHLFTRSHLNKCRCEKFCYCNGDDCAPYRECASCKHVICADPICTSFTCADAGCEIEYCGLCCPLELGPEHWKYALGIKVCSNKQCARAYCEEHDFSPEGLCKKCVAIKTG